MSPCLISDVFHKPPQPLSLHQVCSQSAPIPTGAKNITEAPHQLRRPVTPVGNLHWPLSMPRSRHDTGWANTLYNKSSQLKYDNGTDCCCIQLDVYNWSDSRRSHDSLIVWSPTPHPLPFTFAVFPTPPNAPTSHILPSLKLRSWAPL